MKVEDEGLRDAEGVGCGGRGHGGGRDPDAGDKKADHRGEGMHGRSCGEEGATEKKKPRRMRVWRMQSQKTLR